MEATPPTGEQPPPGQRPTAGQPPVTGEQPITGEHAVGARPDPHERIDGLRAWIAQLERKLGIRTYAIGAAAVLALAGAAVGIVLAMQAQDDSDKAQSSVQEVKTQLGVVGEDASQAAQEEVQSLSGRLDKLESRVSTLEQSGKTSGKRIQVLEDDVADLRTKISDLENSNSGGQGTTTTTTTTTTTPN
jgi:polyhydroxyalkanoate synthesis regulator phasin